jgi:hypothetical protein
MNNFYRYPPPNKKGTAQLSDALLFLFFVLLRLLCGVHAQRITSLAYSE